MGRDAAERNPLVFYVHSLNWSRESDWRQQMMSFAHQELRVRRKHPGAVVGARRMRHKTKILKQPYDDMRFRAGAVPSLIRQGPWRSWGGSERWACRCRDNSSHGPVQEREGGKRSRRRRRIAQGPTRRPGIEPTRAGLYQTPIQVYPWTEGPRSPTGSMPAPEKVFDHRAPAGRRADRHKSTGDTVRPLGSVRRPPASGRQGSRPAGPYPDSADPARYSDQSRGG